MKVLANIYSFLRWSRVPKWKRQTHRLRKIKGKSFLVHLIRKLQR